MPAAAVIWLRILLARGIATRTRLQQRVVSLYLVVVLWKTVSPESIVAASKET